MLIGVLNLKNNYGANPPSKGGITVYKYIDYEKTFIYTFVGIEHPDYQCPDIGKSCPGASGDGLSPIDVYG